MLGRTVRSVAHPAQLTSKGYAVKPSNPSRFVSAATAICVSIALLNSVASLAAPHQPTGGATSVLAQAQTPTLTLTEGSTR